MPRLLFEKKGNAVWISHLDLMRVFQRSFKRAGLSLTHTQGFNPRPSVSIALPLSVGVESCCEILDFDLEGEPVPYEEIQARLNEALIAGVRVLQVYDNGAKLKNLAYLHCNVILEYDQSVPNGTLTAIRALFASETVIVPKKTKTNGIQDQNIIPMIRSLDVRQAGEKELILDSVVCCQNPTLNPMQLYLAIERYLPECKADFVRCCRLEIFDLNSEVFR
ncbi:MAG: DUF2344 domain-containing protein [Oscillospiraceae bacterium]|nr:DUF2344 domain-containing protein [Oscillospiraceae bacterium]